MKIFGTTSPFELGAGGHHEHETVNSNLKTTNLCSLQVGSLQGTNMRRGQLWWEASCALYHPFPLLPHLNSMSPHLKTFWWSRKTPSTIFHSNSFHPLDEAGFYKLILIFNFEWTWLPNNQTLPSTSDHNFAMTILVGRDEVLQWRYRLAEMSIEMKCLLTAHSRTPLFLPPIFSKPRCGPGP